jgi:hypothetical protein
MLNKVVFVHAKVFQPPFFIELCQQKPRKPSSAPRLSPNDQVLGTTNFLEN